MAIELTGSEIMLIDVELTAFVVSRLLIVVDGTVLEAGTDTELTGEVMVLVPIELSKSEDGKLARGLDTGVFGPIIVFALTTVTGTLEAEIDIGPLEVMAFVVAVIEPATVKELC